MAESLNPASKALLAFIQYNKEPHPKEQKIDLQVKIAGG
jgi:hypothetical protein